MSDLGDLTITVNDERRTMPDGSTCRDLVALVTGRSVADDGRTDTGEGLGVALARDGEVIPRGAWAYTALADGDRYEFVTAVQGG